MSITNIQANSLLNYIFGAVSHTAEPNYYVGLSTVADINNTGSNIVEPVGNSYARVAIANNKTTWTNAGSGVLANDISIEFPESSGLWGTILAVVLFDASTSGNALYFENITSRVVNNATTVLLTAGDIDIQMNTSSATYTESNSVLDLEFGASTYTPQSNYFVGLSTTPIAVDGSGATEPVGNNYSRVTIANNKTTWTTAALDGELWNAIQVEFPESSGSWGTITDVALFSLSTLGVVLYSKALDSSRAVAISTTVLFDVAGIDVLMDNS